MAIRCWLSAFVLVVLVGPLPAQASSPGEAVKEGNRLYKQAMYADAAKLYGSAVQDRRQAAVAQYNLGNALYKDGKARADADIDGAIKNMEQSLSNYNEVLKNNAKDEDARYNAAFVGKELERLKKKKEEQDKQKQDQKQGKDQDKKSQPQDQDKKEQSQDQDKDGSKDPKPDPQQDQKKDGQKDKEEEQKQEPGEDKPQEGQPQEPGEMSPKEAKDILEDYQRNQEPKGLLNFIPKNKGERPVTKDW